MIGIRLVCEVGEPAGRINDIHILSPSRVNSVLMPLRNPRSSLISRSGISSMFWSEEEQRRLQPVVSRSVL